MKSEGGGGQGRPPSRQHRPRVGSEVFPLPLPHCFGKCPGPQGVGQGEFTEAVRSLNWLAGFGFSSDLGLDCPSPAQEKILDRVDGLIRRRYRRRSCQEPTQPLSDRLAFNELTGSSGAPYGDPSTITQVASLCVASLSLPKSSLSECPDVESILPAKDVALLRDCVTDPSDPLADVHVDVDGLPYFSTPPLSPPDSTTTTQPYYDPQLRKESVYLDLLKTLMKIDYLDFTREPLEFAGLFAVHKKGGQQRLIIDGRCGNRRLKPPPPVSLATSETFARAECERDGALHMALLDVENCFHRLRWGREYGRYYCFKGVKAGALGISFADGIPVGPDDEVYPFPRSLPMGCSWALWIAQRVGECLLTRILPELRLVKDRGPPAALGKVKSGLTGYLYVDNIGMWCDNEASLAEAVSRVKQGFQELGLLLHDDGMTADRTEALGCELDLRHRCCRVTEKRASRLQGALREALNRRRLAGWELERLLGHATFVALLARPLLSCFSTVYKFVQTAGQQRIATWVSVKEELRAFLGLLPLVESDWRRPWNELVLSSDASEVAFGTAQAYWPKDEVQRVGCTPEKARFVRAAHSARFSALDAAFGEDPGSDLAGPTNDGDEGRLGEEGWQRDQSFPEVPCGGLRRQYWTETSAGRWQYQENITVLEARSCWYGVSRCMQSPANHNCRLVVLLDNMGATLAIGRYRAKSYKLLVIIRRLASLSLACNVLIHPRWIPSELNFTDEATRRYDDVEISKLRIDEITKCFPSEATTAQQYAALASNVATLSSPPPECLSNVCRGCEHEESVGAWRNMQCPRPETAQDASFGGVGRTTSPPPGLGAGDGSSDHGGRRRNHRKRAEEPGRRLRELFVRQRGRLRPLGGGAKAAQARTCSLPPGGGDGSADAAGSNGSLGGDSETVPYRSAPVPEVLPEGEVGGPVRHGPGPVFITVLQSDVLGGAYESQRRQDASSGSPLPSRDRSGQEAASGGEGLEGLDPALSTSLTAGSPARCLVRDCMAVQRDGSTGDVALHNHHGRYLRQAVGTSQGSKERLRASRVRSVKELEPSAGAGGRGNSLEGGGVRRHGESRRRLSRRVARRRAAEVSWRPRRVLRLALHLPRVPPCHPQSGLPAAGGGDTLHGSTQRSFDRPSSRHCRPGGSVFDGGEETRTMGVGPKCTPLREARSLSPDDVGVHGRAEKALHRVRGAPAGHHARQTAPQPTTSTTRQPRFVEFFCGSGGIWKAWRQLGCQSVGVDVTRSAADDLLVPARRLYWLREAREGRVAGAFFAPPCSSFSLARGRGGRCIRSALRPWGVEDLSAEEMQEAREANLLARFALRMICLLESQNKPWALEHPSTSWLWRTGAARRLAQSCEPLVDQCLVDSGARPFEVTFDQCGFGARYRKRTKVLVRPACAEMMTRFHHRRCDGRGLCGFSGRPHLQLNGGHCTKKAARYPRSLAHTFAEVLCRQHPLVRFLPTRRSKQSSFPVQETLNSKPPYPPPLY